MCRAKFVCQSVAKYVGAEQITFIAATSGAGNENWSKYTPSGNLTMSITNEALHGRFTPGKSYYLDITEAS